MDTVTPGPGAYNAEKVDIFPIYKYKASSVFVSKVDRDKNLRGAHSQAHKYNSQGNEPYNPLND